MLTTYNAGQNDDKDKDGQTVREENSDCLVSKEMEFDNNYKWIVDFGITTIDKYNEAKKFWLVNSVFNKRES